MLYTIPMDPFFGEMLIANSKTTAPMRSLPDLDLDETDLGGTLDPRSSKSKMSSQV